MKLDRTNLLTATVVVGVPVIIAIDVARGQTSILDLVAHGLLLFVLVATVLSHVQERRNERQVKSTEDHVNQDGKVEVREEDHE